MLKISQICFAPIFIMILLISGCVASQPIENPAPVIDDVAPVLDEILTKADSVQKIPHLKTLIDASCTLGKE